MKGRKGQEERKLRREKIRVIERRKLTKVRKSSSNRLFMLKRDVSLAEYLIGFKVYVQELLSVKVKRQIGSNGYLYPQLK